MRIASSGTTTGFYFVATGLANAFTCASTSLSARCALQGEAGPKRDIVLMNAAAALMVGGKAKDFKDAAAVASRSIDSGAALARLEALIEFSRRLSAEK